MNDNDALTVALAKMAEALAAIDRVPAPHSRYLQDAREKQLSAEMLLRSAQAEDNKPTSGASRM